MKNEENIQYLSIEGSVYHIRRLVEVLLEHKERNMNN